MNRPAALLVLGLSATLLRAQTDPARVELFTTDELGHLYTLVGDQLTLQAPDGSVLASNSLNFFGPISHIDAFSSLKPMIFSRQQGALALLDNTLSVQGSPMDLPRAGYPQVTLACMSVRNGFWLFDERELALLRVDEQLRPISNSGRLDQLLGISPQPTYMVELDGWLYVCDPDQGVFVFDLFAGYARTLPIRGSQRVEVRDGGVFFVREGKLFRYDLRSMDTALLPWPEGFGAQEVLDARVERGRVFALTAHGVRVLPVR